MEARLTDEATRPHREISAALFEQRDDVRFHIVRNIIYHSARRRSLQSYNRVMTFVVILLGTATASSALTLLGLSPANGTILLGASVTVLASLQLVYDFAVRAKDHEILHRDYFKLLAEIDRVVEPDAQQIAIWRGKLAEIASSEPPTMRALDALAHNEAAQALYGDDVPTLKVGPVKRMLKNLIAFDGARFDEKPTHKLQTK